MVDITKLNMLVPQYNSDKIIGIFTGSFSSSAPTALQQTLYTENSQAHTFGDTCLTQMVFSTDNIIFNDQDMEVPRITGGFPTFQTLDVTAYTTSSNVVVASTNWYDNIAGAGFAYTIYYKVFCIAKKTQGIITPIATNQLLKYSNTDNYQKIAIDEVIPLSIPNGTSTQSIPYNQTTLPSTRAYIEYNSNGKLWSCGPNQYPPTGGGASNNPITTEIHINASTIDYIFNNSSGGTLNVNFHYRIYLET